MSDNWIILIPENPDYIPDEEKRVGARIHLMQLAPDADEIEITVFDNIEFFFCGGNFERICCPACGSEISDEWWQDRMEEDYEDGFKLDHYLTPCCGASRTLHELIYEWPQGFGRFAIEAMNPNIGMLDDVQKQVFEAILGTKLRVIYRHL